MASACVNKSPPPAEFSYGWLSPRASFSRDLAGDPSNLAAGENPDPDPVDFEFRLDDPVAMLPADELFSDGKLVPLHLAPARLPLELPSLEIRSPNSGSDPIAASPRAPRCSSRWRELLGLKRQLPIPKPEIEKSASLPSKASNTKFLKHFLHRNPKSSSIEPSINLPLLRDSDYESISISSRLSLSSSSSSGPDHEDLPRLSLDSVPDKPAAIRAPVRRPRAAAAAMGSSVDSPRMIGSGKIVFEGLERSSSSPGSFGPRPRSRAIERSYSANVRVLNVPVCSLRGSAFGFGQLFSPQKKDPTSARSSAAAGIAKIKVVRALRDLQ